MFSAVPVFVVLWISRFRLEISSSTLSYRTLFGGSRSLPISSIESADLSAGPGPPFAPFVRLTLYPFVNSGARPIVINAKVFSRGDIDQVIEILGPKFKGAWRSARCRIGVIDVLLSPHPPVDPGARPR